MANTTGKKFGGRQKGTKNRIDAEIREEFAIFLKYASPKITGLWEQLLEENPKEALNVIKDYAEFVLPKLQRTEQRFVDEDGEDRDLDVTHNVLGILTDEQLRQLTKNNTE
jgi:hypothetical protein